MFFTKFVTFFTATYLCSLEDQDPDSKKQNVTFSTDPDPNKQNVTFSTHPNFAKLIWLSNKVHYCNMKE